MTTIRFNTGQCGFPDVVHGGLLAGTLAAPLGNGPATAKLRQAVRPDVDYELSHEDGRVILSGPGGTVAEAKRWTPDLDVPPCPDPEQAKTAGETDVPQRRVMPTCFACGLGRAPGESLRLAVGPLEHDLAAGLWTPHPALATADGTLPDTHVWAALDCPALWALHLLAGGERQRIVTGALSGAVHGRVQAGEAHVLIGWPVGARRAGAAIYRTDGTLVAAGTQLCVQTEWGFPTGGN